MNAPDRSAPALVGLTPTQLKAAAIEASALREPLMRYLETQFGETDTQLIPAVAESLGMDVVSMAELLSLTPNFDRLTFGDALRLECLIAESVALERYLVVADPFDDALRDRVETLLGELPPVRLARRADIVACLNRYEETSRALDSVGSLQGASRAEDGHELSLAAISADQSPVVRLVNSTLLDALKSGSSDIHLETTPAGMHIKYRIDGVLTSVSSLQNTELSEQVIARIKVLAELDIAERRVPQDGRFRVLFQNRDIDLRISIMPSIHGEDAVLRVLDRKALSDEMAGLSLASLGFEGAPLATLRRLSALPYGMLLVTGPTGSGKTTTLYGALGEINHGHDKIITIEDPVEYQLPGVLQIPVNEKKGLTFARGLRSILRHDPDKIMVGEIRDGETAQIAVQAALTGHLVFTTVHANNAFDVLGRFSHMGVDPHSLVAALNGIVAQRLVRLNCPQCSEARQPAPELLTQYQIAALENDDFRAGRGCGHCRGSGYKGRKAVAEILVLDDELRELVIERAPVRQIKALVRARGGKLLLDAGIDLARKGETSLAEVNRVLV